MASIYDQIGGGEMIRMAVERFYRKMLLDDRVASFFDSADMDRQIAKQASFLTMVTGGPNYYTGKDMRAAHRPLVNRGLADMHVDVVLGHLRDTFTELGVAPELVDGIIAIADGMRNDVLCRDGQSAPGDGGGEAGKAGRDRDPSKTEVAS
jgi:hemoglobin